MPERKGRARAARGPPARCLEHPDHWDGRTQLHEGAAAGDGENGYPKHGFLHVDKTKHPRIAPGVPWWVRRSGVVRLERSLGVEDDRGRARVLQVAKAVVPSTIQIHVALQWHSLLELSIELVLDGRSPRCPWRWQEPERVVGALCTSAISARYPHACELDRTLKFWLRPTDPFHYGPRESGALRSFADPGT